MQTNRDTGETQLLSPMAADGMIGRQLAQGGRLVTAALDRVGAAGVERATRRRIGGVRDLTTQHDPLAASAWVGHRHR